MTMVTDEQVAALRAAMTGDYETFGHFVGKSVDGRDPAFAVLMTQVFVIAAQGRFPASSSTAELIRFVGQLRSRDEGKHADVVASAAEQMLLCAIHGETASQEFGEEVRGYTQFALIMELVADLRLDDGQVDELLDMARQESDQRLIRRAFGLLPERLVGDE